MEISQGTKMRSDTFKLKMISYYDTLIQETVDRDRRYIVLKHELHSSTHTLEKKQRKLDNYSRTESAFLRVKRLSLSPSNFLQLQVIGRGAYGQVSLVQKLDNGKIYAMKTMKKTAMILQHQLAHVKAERDLMSLATSNPWITKLFYSFQDSQNLYLVMEFMSGGDLMGLLIKYDTFNENVCRFYMAEACCAIRIVHELGFVHRDIKPDNFLLDSTGHLKLADFGLASSFTKGHSTSYYEKYKQEQLNNLGTIKNIDERLGHLERVSTWKKNRRNVAYSTVGSPNYIAPEGLID